MKARTAKVVIPFLITFTLGILISRVFISRVGINCGRPQFSRVEILSVPEIDFTDGAKRSPRRNAAVKLRALFDSDGTVKEVRRFAMIPYGVSECSVGKGDFANYTHATVQGRFVEELPYGLTDRAIDLVKGIKFTPSTENSFPQATFVTAIVEFNPGEPMGWPNSDPIYVSVFDNTGVLWSGEASIYDDCQHHKKGQ